MLYEICCEEFRQKRIIFQKGFNVILGTNSGHNSIGKSTLMLIIDYVYGGDTYSEVDDIRKNVGEHNICFQFIFADKAFYFSRSFINNKEVWKCNDKYERIDCISISEYREWLSHMYNIERYGLSFRNAVGRYIRVYGKDNCNEKRPLCNMSKEDDQSAILSLIKLFDKYKAIEEIKAQADASRKAYNTFDNARKCNYIPNIGVRNYNENKKEIERLKIEIDKISKELNIGLLDRDSYLLEEVITQKNELLDIKRRRNIVKNRFATIQANLNYSFPSFSESTHELERFFPGVNVKHIEEIEYFHKQIAEIFKNELKEEETKLQSQIKEYDNIIEDLEKKLNGMNNNIDFSTIALNKYAEVLKTIEKLERENETFCKHKELKDKKKTDENKLIDIKYEQLKIIEQRINIKMDSISKELYDENYNAPEIHFTKSNYTFNTPNDTGTGVAYKGLIVFDLAIANLTGLPILVHDSILFKHLSDEVFGNIVRQYINCNKQIFIAIDKQKSYGDEIAELLEKYKAIELSPNGGALFGRSWGKVMKTYRE